MKRRDLLKSILPVGASLLVTNVKTSRSSQTQTEKNLPMNRADLTRYVADFVLKLKYEDIPAEIISLGKKSILDGFGLALAGSMEQAGPLSRAYVQSLGSTTGNATVIGSPLKASPRFAAFVNGISIHADDFDDTQL